jgi:5-methylcytosine-specific restriction endonuclease McrA
VDEAYRRVSAARLVRRFPPLLDAIATGELRLTGLLMLGRHLTDENLLEVLARAKHRTKKEIARLVRVLDPLPDVPPRIEPLGPPPVRLVSEAPTWGEFVGSMCPVRELTPGNRPSDWVDPAVEGDRANDFGEPEAMFENALVVEPEPLLESAAPFERPTLAPARLGPERYAVQFTASEEYVRFVEEARALLSHSAPRATLDELHPRAMRALVAELKRRKYAVQSPSRKRASGSPSPFVSATETLEAAQDLEATQELEAAQDFEATQELEIPEPPGGSSHSGEAERTPEPEHVFEHELSRRRGRTIPASVRRAVFERDEGRCTYVDASGQRCRETYAVELHHLTAFAQGGEHSESNVTLRCRPHNALAAEKDFGKDFIEHKRASREHEHEHEPWPTPGAGR